MVQKAKRNLKNDIRSLPHSHVVYCHFRHHRNRYSLRKWLVAGCSRNKNAGQDSTLRRIIGGIFRVCDIFQKVNGNRTIRVLSHHNPNLSGMIHPKDRSWTIFRNVCNESLRYVFDAIG